MVLYRLTDRDVEQIQINRARLLSHHFHKPPLPRAGDVLPAVVVSVYAAWKSIDAPPAVSLHVFLDGPDTHYVTDVTEVHTGESEPGQWFWPPRV